jgi:hypothetical protein
MELGSAALGNIARMICGDQPYNFFPYRSSSYLTAFFEALNMDYAHDGSTRYWWVRSVLLELNKDPEGSDRTPSLAMTKVIEYLLHPDHFVGVSNCDQSQALQAINAVLASSELEVILNPKTHLPRLAPMDGSFVSTAVDVAEAVRKITFSPKVFNVPDGEMDAGQVSVMMPFSAEFNGVYDAIKNACIAQSMKCFRADDIWSNSTFIQDIFELIFTSCIVVVDFSGRNENVMYETGIAHTLGKVVIPITQSLDDIPSDLKPHRALKYYPNAEGLTALTSQLSKRIRTILDGGRWKE